MTFASAGRWFLSFTLPLILVLPAQVLLTGTAFSIGKPHPATDIPGVVRHGERKSREVALTFDACSPRGRGRLDTAVARILIQTRTPATIFLGGKWAKDVSRALRPLIRDSLVEFGNHAYMHPHLKGLSGDSVKLELRKAQRAIARVIGKRPVLFRAPYGEVDSLVAVVAESLGLTSIEYDLASGDPDSLISKEAMVRYVTSMARGGSIIVMHINTRGWHTAEALPGIIAGLRKRGFTLVTVSRLIGPRRKNAPGPR
jgi:peptidoglycan/xylan/chitin deacetylase (PgdA/CDA1 family)